MHFEIGRQVLIGERIYDILDIKMGEKQIQHISIGPVTPENTEYVRKIFGGSGISTKHQKDRMDWRRDQPYHIHVLSYKIKDLTVLSSNKNIAHVLERYDD